MQENRSFDHYFGVMRGVRGFGDPHPVTLPSGKPVWFQANGRTVVPPFRPDVGKDLSLDLHRGPRPHLGRVTRDVQRRQLGPVAAEQDDHLHGAHGAHDLPFHYALADAFTVCDGNFCSMLGPTDPNRYYMWTGWDGNDGKGGGPVIANDEIGYDWQTYPERLQAAGISWKIYQDVGEGLDAAGFWGCTAIRSSATSATTPCCTSTSTRMRPRAARSTRGPAPGPTPRASATTSAPSPSSSNPRGRRHERQPAPGVMDRRTRGLHRASRVPAGYGAWYTAGVLNALTSNPEVWSKTALIITFDENDGFFDHVRVPYPNVGERSSGESTVPLDNEMFDGTRRDARRFERRSRPLRHGHARAAAHRLTVEHRRLGVLGDLRPHVADPVPGGALRRDEPNITPWRRAVCGDLTSAFDFISTDDDVPSLPDVAAYKPSARRSAVDFTRRLRRTERCRPRSRASASRAGSDYNLHVGFQADNGTLNLALRNHGRIGAHLQARSLTVPGGPYSYTIGAGDEITASLPNPGVYDLSLHGANGFFRHFTGSVATTLRAEVHGDHDSGRLRVKIINEHHGRGRHSAPVVVNVANAYGPDHNVRLNGGREELVVDTHHCGGWYDLALTSPNDKSFTYQLAGRLESAGRLTSDPQLGRP